MLLEKKQQAKNLFFHSELNKTQIANLLQVSRRSISNWIQEGNWDRLKRSAEHLPAIIAENCYHIMNHLTRHHMSECRLTNPITPKEVDGLYKLSLTINKVKNRSTLNESMEMFGFFMEGLRMRNEKLADELSPYIDEYISSRAGVYAHHLVPDSFTGIGGRIPWQDPTVTPEQQLDAREAFFSDHDTVEAYARAGMPFPTQEEIETLPVHKEQPQVVRLYTRAGVPIPTKEELEVQAAAAQVPPAVVPSSAPVSPPDVASVDTPIQQPFTPNEMPVVAAAEPETEAPLPPPVAPSATSAKPPLQMPFSSGYIQERREYNRNRLDLVNRYLKQLQSADYDPEKSLLFELSDPRYAPPAQHDRPTFGKELERTAQKNGKKTGRYR